MRNRAPALTAVVAFAAAIAVVAGLAGRGGDPALVKLPVASLGGDAGAAHTAAASMSERGALVAPAFGPVEYRLGGPLPELPGTAPAYRLRSHGSPAAVPRLAAALGVDGDVREDDGAWVVRDGARQLRVERFAGLPWYLGTVCPEATVSSEVKVGDAEAGSNSVMASCAGAAASAAGGGSSPSSAGGASAGNVPAPRPVPPGRAVAIACDAPGTACSVPAPPPCPPGAECAASLTPTAPGTPVAQPTTGPSPAPTPAAERERPAELPSRAEAERLARDTFTRMGVALDGFTLEDGWTTWVAKVEPRVDGLAAMGLGHGLGIGGGGEIVHANGFLAVPDRIGDYPLVGADAGLRRLQDGFDGGPRTLGASVAREPAPAPPPDAEPAVDLAADACPPGAACATAAAPVTVPEPGAPPAPVVRTVTGVHLVLLHVDAMLVPAYVFELDDGGETPPVVAVADEWLAAEAGPEKG